ncbi:carboxymuconolactone decarboxylase family protein [Ramlibacter algicola]|uniref:Carboxymuconolactone decarboxylase family protein n=1 Tax=Ramlibacter algicola TaxID=2795217 RepID=A0A934PZR5_9BURK|nr:carboxymuconolactone decarboxylase family protein [Ramlibacter algicola]
MHSLYVGQFDPEQIQKPHVTARRMHAEGFSAEFLDEALEQVQYPLFGRWGLIGEKGGNDIYADRCSVYIFGQYYGRDGLDLKTRGLLVVSALSVLLREGVLPTWTNACRNLGWSEDQLKELGALVSHIGGFPVSRGALMMMDEVFEKRRAITGEPVESRVSAETRPDLYEAACHMAERLFGQRDGDFDDLPLPAGDPFRKEMVTWVFGYLFTERSLIPVRAKVLAVIAMCAALGRTPMARRWMGAARRIGCSRVEVQETIITAALYGGWPSAREALGALAETWPLQA